MWHLLSDLPPLYILSYSYRSTKLPFHAVTLSEVGCVGVMCLVVRAIKRKWEVIIIHVPQFLTPLGGLMDDMCRIKQSYCSIYTIHELMHRIHNERVLEVLTCTYNYMCKFNSNVVCLAYALQNTHYIHVRVTAEYMLMRASGKGKQKSI